MDIHGHFPPPREFERGFPPFSMSMNDHICRGRTDAGAQTWTFMDIFGDAIMACALSERKLTGIKIYY
jgi:hypothetical protein